MPGMQIEYGTRVTGVDIPAHAGQPLLVHTAPAKPLSAPEEHHAAQHATRAHGQQTLRCQLLIGADGLSSTVRKALIASQPGQGWEPQEVQAGVPTGNKCWKARPARACCAALSSWRSRACAAHVLRGVCSSDAVLHTPAMA